MITRAVGNKTTELTRVWKASRKSGELSLRRLRASSGNSAKKQQQPNQAQKMKEPQRELFVVLLQQQKKNVSSLLNSPSKALTSMWAAFRRAELPQWQLSVSTPSRSSTADTSSLWESDSSSRSARSGVSPQHKSCSWEKKSETGREHLAVFVLIYMYTPDHVTEATLLETGLLLDFAGVASIQKCIEIQLDSSN